MHGDERVPPTRSPHDRQHRAEDQDRFQPFTQKDRERARERGAGAEAAAGERAIRLGKQRAQFRDLRLDLDDRRPRAQHRAVPVHLGFDGLS